jgi:hypothetical protein
MENLLAPARSSGAFSNLETIMQTDGSDEMETVRGRYRSKTTGRNGSDANRGIDWIDIGC